MAKPIELMPKRTAQGVREELQRKLDAAPVEHAEAVLAGYELLQQLHESGTLDLLRGALGAGDQVVRHAVALAIQPEAVNGLRNLLLLARLLGDVNPDTLHQAFGGIPAALAKQTEENPPSLIALFKRFSSIESRRALAAAATVLESVGKGLGSGK